jgi:hypothetical protein
LDFFQAIVSFSKPHIRVLDVRVLDVRVLDVRVLDVRVLGA